MATLENTIIIFVCPPKFCISIVSSFSWDLQWRKEKTKTLHIISSLKSIMVFSEVAYLLSLSTPVSVYKGNTLARFYVQGWPASPKVEGKQNKRNMG